MNSSPLQAILGGVAAIVAGVAVTVPGALPLVAILAVVVAAVAFLAQSERLRGEDRLVYRPVYVRRQDVRHRVRSDD